MASSKMATPSGGDGGGGGRGVSGGRGMGGDAATLHTTTVATTITKTNTTSV